MAHDAPMYLYAHVILVRDISCKGRGVDIYVHNVCVDPGLLESMYDSLRLTVTLLLALHAHDASAGTSGF